MGLGSTTAKALGTEESGVAGHFAVRMAIMLGMLSSHFRLIQLESSRLNAEMALE